MDTSAIKQLLNIIEQQLDWGSADAWQTKDFENLNLLIFERTKVSLSASTLRRLWGRVEYNHLPSTTTLDTMARFAGFESWRAFTKQNKPAETTASNNTVIPTPIKQKPVWQLKAVIIIVAVAATTLIAMYIKKEPVAAAKGVYSFSYKPVTRDIPNSVIFSYDAKAAPTDSVFIQQSWDPQTRALVDKNHHQHTSVYYRPGSYHAKLVVNNHIVAERPLLLATNGWLGLIAHIPVPVYLNKGEYTAADVMGVTASTIQKNNIAMGPQPPMVEFYNVGNFDAAPLNDFAYSVELKNTYHEGAAACSFINVSLITNGVPVIFRLSSKGCISDLNLLDGQNMVSGKSNDLSGFGADLSAWIKVSCRSSASKIQYYVNDKLAYESPMPSKKMTIVGLGYSFQGAGSVRNINLQSGGKVIFHSF
jgi:hypothetical protein